MTENIREHSCPNCGAPLGIPDKHERFFKCQFCGTILEDQATEEEQNTGVFKIEISKAEISSAKAARVPVYAKPPVKPARTSNRLGCIIGISIFLLVGGILAVSLVPALITTGNIGKIVEGTGVEKLIESSGLNAPELYGYGPVRLLSSDNDTSPDFVGAAFGPESKTLLTYIDFENDPALRWINEITGDQVTYIYNQFLADDARVYFNYDTKITAYNREQGTFLWEVTLSDKIQHNICPGCFQMFDDTIATLSTDGMLQAWDTAAGSLNWQVKLNGTPRQIVNFGGNPAVLDEVDDTVGMKVFNLSNGSILQQIFPACPNDPFPNDPQEIGIYDYIQPLADDAGVVFFGGFFEPGCAMHWRPGADSQTWMAKFDSDIVSNLSAESLLLIDETLYIAKRNGVHALDLATGTFSTLYVNEEYNFFPAAAREGVLVLRAERTRGTRQWEIWGVDTQLGNVKWTFVPDAENYSDTQSVSGSVRDDGLWAAGLTAEGLTVAQAFDQSPRIIFQTITLQSGTTSTPVTLDLSNESSSFQFKVLGWRSNGLWFVEDTVRPRVRLVDITNGEQIFTWP